MLSVHLVVHQSAICQERERKNLKSRVFCCLLCECAMCIQSLLLSTTTTMCTLIHPFPLLCYRNSPCDVSTDNNNVNIAPDEVPIF